MYKGSKCMFWMDFAFCFSVRIAAGLKARLCTNGFRGRHSLPVFRPDLYCMQAIRSFSVPVPKAGKPLIPC